MIGWVEDPDTYPIQPKAHTMEFLREVAHLRPRTNVIAAATRVRHSLAKAIHRFFDDKGFFWVNTPIITASDAEGAGALFRVSTLDFANLPRNPLRYWSVQCARRDPISKDTGERKILRLTDRRCGTATISTVDQ